ncbi:MAG: 4-hydroxy-3-methylbut-2-en-yl diphosphate reductase [Actinomycetota bacterium]|jgi:4-hydroxy-3-methylbut-2-enyl diphosphate reductase|nr:4-hydroxy-3-methylbut-2-en-yl diphosphate reductase [Actinomycetota bacterium]
MVAMRKKVVLAAPRGYCAGVDRAVQIVERALDTVGAPVYVRKEIVHNRHVVEELQKRGAIFVESEQEIPEGATCVFSAHGVSPEVRRNADARNLRVIDATCPLVTKVHLEAKRFVRDGRRIVLVGHEGHEEIEGTAGEAPDSTMVIERPEQIDELGIDSNEPIAYLTQTTLSVDDTLNVVEALRGRFSDISGPRSDDICYATQNRQVAVKAIAPECDVVLIVGAFNSSNSNRLVEVARSLGTPAHLVPDETHLDPTWLDGAETVGVSSGASAPEVLVDRLLKRLSEMGYGQVETREITTEDVTFSLPPWLRDEAEMPPVS